jgi:hypothetical protein
MARTYRKTPVLAVSNRKAPIEKWQIIATLELYGIEYNPNWTKQQLLSALIG